MGGETPLYEFVQRLHLGLVQLLRTHELRDTRHHLDAQRVSLLHVQEGLQAVNGQVAHCPVAGDATLELLQEVIIAGLRLLVSFEKTLYGVAEGGVALR
jgi:hypothetical protein